ncbi:MAG: DM13 domain-containing protein [Pseudomonadota bacterium]
MSTRRALLLAASHGVVGLAGVGAGIYLLPILTAPPPPALADVQAAMAAPGFKARFVRDLVGSDALHWGEGEVTVSASVVAFAGRLAPGPDYKLYLVPAFVQTEAEFLRLKPRALRVGDIKSFNGFLLPLPAGTDPAAYTTVLVWCETFGEFISAAQYR